MAEAFAVYARYLTKMLFTASILASSFVAVISKQVIHKNLFLRYEDDCSKRFKFYCYCQFYDSIDLLA